MHRQFGSRFLIDSLHEYGFSVSYTEVQKYEKSAAVHQGTEISGFSREMCLQYVADNVDHNIRTIDGLDTFHGMGIIATITPGTCNLKPVPRKTVTAEDVAAVGRIDLKYVKPKDNFEIPLRFTPLPQFTSEDPSANIDLLWQMSWLLKPLTPSWNGFMQMVQHGPHLVCRLWSLCP
jgi:hypothetical protein